MKNISDATKRRLDLLISITLAGMICAIAYLVYKYALRLIMPFLVAFIIVSLVHPLIRRLKKAVKTDRGVVSFLVMLVIYTLLGTGLFFLIVNLAFRAMDMFRGLSGFYENALAPSMTQFWESVSVIAASLPVEMHIDIGTVQDAMMQGVQSSVMALSQRGLEGVTAFMGGLATFLISFIFTIMLSFFISVRYDAVVLFIKTQLPQKIQDNLAETRGILKAAVGRYLKAYLTMMFITFCELAIGLSLLGARGALLIAAGVAVLDAFPIVGTGTVLIPWTIFEVIRGSYTMALGLIILYATITFVRYILEPKIVGDNLGLNPIVSLMAIYLGFMLFGVFGMIIMPIATQLILELHRRGKIKLFRDVAE
ncbi:MAG: sporulation integral membrane protein YtvI [Oscillospiraceae bacterium]|nr:sporulation integral membrane protein YtvI [Oscillospiraceae bacterium]